MIPTAKDFLEKDESGVYSPADITHTMIMFAKLHVEEALKQASEKVKTKSRSVRKGLPGYSVTYNKEVIDKKSILNAYPLNNIR